MTDVPPPQVDSISLTIAERGAEILRSLTLQHILTLALLLILAIPSWFSWRFMQDMEFRHEFMSTAKILEMNVPCLVLRASISEKGDRYAISATYDVRSRLEYLITIRSPGLLGDHEIKEVCDLANAEVAKMKAHMEPAHLQDR